MDAIGWTVEELRARIGKAPHRITERTALLYVRPEYQPAPHADRLPHHAQARQAAQ